MSRIHDALKKAAEERAWQPPANSAQTFVEVTEGNIRSAQAGNGPDTALENGSRKADKQTFLRFEQLLKRRAVPNSQVAAVSDCCYALVEARRYYQQCSRRRQDVCRRKSRTVHCPPARPSRSPD